VRSNAVLAVEYLITASPEGIHGKSRQQQDAYFADALKWLEERHGKKNVVYAGIHRDEITPHMYAYVVPIDERGKLNCRAFLGGTKALSAMQTEFANIVGGKHDLERGIAGSKAPHTKIRDYYTRVNAAFEPLPEVKTIPPPLRVEPEKPGFFAAKETKVDWQNNHAAWQQEKAVADKLAEQRRLEVKVQQDAAIETARRHQAQAQEAAALKVEVATLKSSNGRYTAKAAQWETVARKLMEVTALFTPDEIRAAGERKRQQQQKEAETTRQNEIAKEKQRRIDDIPNLAKLAGAAHCFYLFAIEALRKVKNTLSGSDWRAVEAKTTHEAIGRHGQSSESVIQALTRFSPERADPATHPEIRDAIERAAPELTARYKQERQERDIKGFGWER
jgi:hypothetical protein